MGQSGPWRCLRGQSPAFIGTETWNRNGLYFSRCMLYEFIPEAEMYKNLDDPSYVPRTICMDEVAAGEVYEIVLTVLKGGAFARYRVGMSTAVWDLPARRMRHGFPGLSIIDRVPDIIDIAGFTRISENSIKNVISLPELM